MTIQVHHASSHYMTPTTIKNVESVEQITIYDYKVTYTNRKTEILYNVSYVT